MASTSRWHLLLTGGSGIITILCLIFTIVIVMLKSHMSDRSQEYAIHGDIVCIECNKLTPVGDEQIARKEIPALIEKLPRRVENDVEKCCAYNRKHMAIVLDIIARKCRKTRGLRVTSKLKRKRVWIKRVSAHRRFVRPAGIAGTKGGLPLFLEDRNVPLSLDPDSSHPDQEHSQNVEVMRSGYHVLLSGLYHVYSSVHFSAPGREPCSSFKKKTWWQHVVLIRPSDPMRSGPLLAAAHSCCDNCTREKETSSTGGVFTLSAGDYLSVEVSSPGLIAFEKESSFFGLSMLGDVSSENDLGDRK